jgi:predicted DNA-binding protein
MFVWHFTLKSGIVTWFITIRFFQNYEEQTMLNIAPELEQHYQIVAQQMNKPVNELVNSILMERLEDLLDILAAEETLKRIDAGLEKTYSIDEMEAMLDGLDS